MEKNCIICNKIFYYKPSRKNVKYCCNFCKNEGNKISRIIKVCPICSKQFKVYPSSDVKYCSNQCFAISRKNPEIEKKCINCGKKFIIRLNREKNKQFCSTSCSMSFRLKDEKFRKIFDIINIGRTHSTETRRKLRIKHINRIKSLGINVYPNWNPKACDYFEKFDLENNTQGQHARNGGEFHIKELGYWVDYINHDLKLIMEYDEKYHDKQKEKDLKRQEEIESFFSEYKFIRIKDE